MAAHHGTAVDATETILRLELDMVEIFGLVFGGVSRLAQHWMDLREKEKERAHEAVMYEKQIELADKKYTHDAGLRRIDGENADSAAEWAAMTAAIESQAKEAQAAGGFVAKFSAAMRPFLTFWHVVVIYTAFKVAVFCVALSGGLHWDAALIQIYGDADKSLCFSMASFWFADRALRKVGRA